MRSVVLSSVLTMALFGFGLSACTDDSEPTASETATENVETGMESAGNQISEWKNSTESELSTFDNKFSEWKAELQGKDTEAEYHEKVGELEKMRAEIGQKIENAGDVSQENWDEFKNDVNGQVTTLKNEWQELTN